MVHACTHGALNTVLWAVRIIGFPLGVVRDVLDRFDCTLGSCFYI